MSKANDYLYLNLSERGVLRGTGREGRQGIGTVEEMR